MSVRMLILHTFPVAKNCAALVLGKWVGLMYWKITEVNGPENRGPNPHKSKVTGGFKDGKTVSFLRKKDGR
ncbi:hypothetical protein GCM10007416_35060 [Kroppenstedtia guangzhouensis]|uniref:Uncharacterized protein n=1 Tax=Kroppenstedtia guangzhouensis TaxID=1274356 RepID=A0ABQ1H4W6_9BACL|nr:hypothetical protein GCM10007416_35060 [Kroppenstedtia guangzhouensis]